MRDPESLTPASRLIIDSVRSPKRDPKKFRNPKAIALALDKEMLVSTKMLSFLDIKKKFKTDLNQLHKKKDHSN